MYLLWEYVAMWARERSECSQHWLQAAHNTWGNCTSLASRYKSPTIILNANSADSTVNLRSRQQQDHLYVRTSGKEQSSLVLPTGTAPSSSVTITYAPRDQRVGKNTSPSCLGKNKTCCVTNYQLIKRNPSGLFQVHLNLVLGNY